MSKRDILEDTYGHTKGYDELLRSLAAQNTEATERKRKRKEGKAGKSRDATEKEHRKSKRKEKAPTQRLHHRKKYIANKDVSKYSEAQLKEIFGV